MRLIIPITAPYLTLRYGAFPGPADVRILDFNAPQHALLTGFARFSSVPPRARIGMMSRITTRGLPHGDRHIPARLNAYARRHTLRQRAELPGVSETPNHLASRSLRDGTSQPLPGTGPQPPFTPLTKGRRSGVPSRSRAPPLRHGGCISVETGHNPMQKFMPILVPFVLALLIAAPVAAQPRSDTLLRDEIASAIEDADLPIGIFDVEVRDGVAVLSGEVLNEATRSRVVELALFVDGVAAVETNITVLEPDDLGDPDAEPDGPEDPEAAAPAPLPEEEAGAAPPAPARGMATRPDDAVRSEVAREIERADLEGGDPRVSVVDGVVRLTGQVVSAWEWRDVVERAESVAGVLAVDPDLEVAEPESMDDLVEGVRRAVLRYSYYTVFDDINFGMEKPYEIVLLGAVTEPFKKTEIEKRVSRVFGVKSVDNRIEVLPLSPNDQDLRRALYYRIYRDPRFSDRANRVNPPIHIVVSRGVVALTGVVRSAIESRILESIARSTPGVFRVINRLEH